MFRLLRYFSISGLIAYVLVTGIFGLFYQQLAVRDLIDMEERSNVALTQVFANSVWPELTTLLASPTTSTANDLSAAAEIARLQQGVSTKLTGLSVIKVKVFNLDGVTIFSTKPQEIGEIGDAQGGFIAARSGSVTSELTRQTPISTPKGTLTKQDVLSSYIPVYDRQVDGKIVGVFELYNNVTPMLARIQTMQRKLVLGFALALAALYALFFLIVGRGDSILRRQYQAQQSATEQLHQHQLALAAAKERERLARDLHDSVGQVLGYINTQCQAIRLLLTKQPEAAEAQLKRLIEVAQSTQADVRESIFNLQTGATPKPDFLTALHAYVDQFTLHHHLPVEFIGAETLATVNFTPALQLQLLRIMQEALTNVRKHARANAIQIQLTQHGDQVQIAVIDNGRGFDRSQIEHRQSRTFGLQIMQDRSAEFGGKVEIYSQIGQGTRVIVQIPWSSKQATPLPDAKRKEQAHERTPDRRSSTFFGRSPKPAPSTRHHRGWRWA